MTREFLLEIGTEEIPAKFLPGAIKQLEELAQKALDKEKLTYEQIRVWATPRRLVLNITGLPEKQADVTEEVKGPAKKAAFDAEGKPTKAVEGFARSQGVALADLLIKEVNGVEYVFARKEIKGRSTAEVMTELAPTFISGLSFPKPMRWAHYDFRFARPIRWLLCLLDDQVLEFKLENLVSGRLTYGHRVLGPGPFTVNHASEYRQLLLEKGYVMVDQEERRRQVWQQIQDLAAREGGQVEEDADLLEEIIYLLEYPTALCGSFEAEFLQLPDEVIITPMKEHQRYFPVRDQQGRLLNKFITVRNGTADYIEIVREGNEKVLRARLADARFFYEEDQKQPLAAYLPRLDKIVFQENLGTLGEKVQRIQNLTSYLAETLQVVAEEKEIAARTARLAKADLVTSMVYEFPELQGIMGRYYARLSGEREEVAQAIFEHYLPRFAGDMLPASVAGAMVSIADKLDTIVGCFAVGIQPTGSQDPYALRRQALGICHILLQRGWHLDLPAAINRAYAAIADKPGLKLDREKTVVEVMEFFRLRLRYILMEDEGLAYDTVDAVLAAGYADLTAAAERARALAKVRQEADFADVQTAFTRVVNLAKKDEGGQVVKELLQEPAEQALLAAWQAFREESEELLRAGRYEEWFKRASQLRPVIDRFFTEVMVMAKEEDLRRARLALLRELAADLSAAADLSKLA
ncbi:glycyl-tRNA synthetase beta chain [Carboxydocella sporoproducens DSM 16521]|uniref:Glycine--tRNA ligase beta subunit n=2 Tax=Carboxydocella TaxID=178898 RepID=A0A1T4NGX5_9FIRM|nr:MULTISPECIES: glycine--tRNA ligase subunit beta [Carboxydocella]AVX20038.1 glycyl-tRNA synthetase beta chain [Carboxydocella thermautotrophica]SJZ78510.1 glycyl-tRNA synthetase beta chain [Carboxydocella sporoproducens DSM 16521]